MGIPVATITCAGKQLDPEIELLGLEIRRELNRIPEAKLELLDGSVAQRAFALSNGELFVPGTKITIALRYEGETDDVPMFEGLIVRHALEAGDEGTHLRVEAKDAAFKLTRQRKSAVFRDASDDEAIRKLLEGSGVTPGEPFAAATVKHPELIQYNASTWDFIVSRAEVMGLVVDVHLAKLALAKLGLGEVVKRKLSYGLSGVHQFELELDGSQQWAELASVGWDPSTLAPTEPTPAAPPALDVGNLDADAIATRLGGASQTLLHPVPFAPGELQAWADARLLHSRFALLRGHVTIDGDPELGPLDTVELEGISDRVNGFALVSAITHKLDHDGWKSELQLGLSPEWFARKPDIAEVAAGGLLPALTSLQIAKVAAFEADPLGEHRIKLQLPALAADQGFVWARVARPDAGKDRGSVFWPELDDEVVVGFLDGDPRQPVVLGSLFGSLATPPAIAGPPSQDNFKRAIVSKAGTAIAFDDQKPSLTITTPGKNTIVVDDAAKSITIADQHGNQILLSDKGIKLTSASDFTIEATGKVVIKGSAVDVQ